MQDKCEVLNKEFDLTTENIKRYCGHEALWYYRFVECSLF